MKLSHTTLAAILVLTLSGADILLAQNNPQQRPDRRGPGGGQRRPGGGGGGGGRGGTAPDGTVKPRMSDTIRANVYADNSFELYINGRLTIIDSIAFIPHNVISVDILPKYPMTIAVKAIDNADAKTGMEYSDTNIGDGGFILKFADGTVTNAQWKAKCVFFGPLNGDVKNPKVKSVPLPKNWTAPEFDDSKWENATVHTEEAIGPKEPYYENDFAGAQFIWTKDLKLDNTILFRYTVKEPKIKPATQPQRPAPPRPAPQQPRR
jgi:hypothetical protein